MRKFAVILGAGIGNRFKSDIPKQFTNLCGEPVLFHSIRKFHQVNPSIHIILVLAQNKIEFWNTLIDQHQFNIPHHVIAGGATRSQSVYNALNSISEIGIVAIHDGARPNVSINLITKLFLEGNEHNSAVPSIPLADTLIKREKVHIIYQQRELYSSLQTPQVYNLEMIRKAYELCREKSYNDDSEVWNEIYGNVNLIEGENQNVKLTFVSDLGYLKSIIKNS